MRILPCLLWLLSTAAALAQVPAQEIALPGPVKGIILHPILTAKADSLHWLRVTRIDITRNGHPLQTLTVPDGSQEVGPAGTGPMSVADLFSFPDCRFDGHRDIVVLQGNAVLGNTRNAVWVYDVKSARFVYSSELSDLTSPEFDAVHRRILTVDRAQAGLSYSNQTLVWRNGHLMVIRDESQNLIDAPQPSPQVRRIVKEARDGRLQTVSDVTLVIHENGSETVIKRNH